MPPPPTNAPPPPHPPPPPQPPQSFTVTAPPTSDIWAAPPSTRRFSAPLAHASRGPLRTFARAGLTLALIPPQAESQQLVQYDQGGIILAITPSTGEPSDAKRWLKTGIEMYEGEPWLTVVGCDRWSDLSMVPLGWAGGGGSAEEGGNRIPTATVEVERVKEALWVYWVVEGAKEGRRRVPIREVNWFFAHDEMADETWEVSVAAYAARPLKNEKDEDEGLDVKFGRFEVEWS